MISFFKDKSAVAVFWLIILSFGLHIYSLINPPPLASSINEGFFYYIMRPFQNLEAYTLSMLYVFIVFLLALQINFIINDLRMLPKQSYTTAVAFLLLSASLPAFNQISPALLACNLLIWIIYGACRLYNAHNGKTSIYNLGLLTGTGVVLYYPMLPVIIVIMLALAIMRPFRVTEWFVLLFGILTPIYFLVSYLF